MCIINSSIYSELGGVDRRESGPSSPARLLAVVETRDTPSFGCSLTTIHGVVGALLSADVLTLVTILLKEDDRVTPHVEPLL